MKPKRIGYKVALKRAHKALSEFIRAEGKKRYPGKCYICKAGSIECNFHFIPRGNLSTTLEPDNCCASCMGCNFREKKARERGNLIEIDRFRKIHIEMVGKPRVEELEMLARRPKKFTPEELLEIEKRFIEAKERL